MKKNFLMDEADEDRIICENNNVLFVRITHIIFFYFGNWVQVMNILNHTKKFKSRIYNNKKVFVNVIKYSKARIFSTRLLYCTRTSLKNYFIVQGLVFDKRNLYIKIK